MRPLLKILVFAAPAMLVAAEPAAAPAAKRGRMRVFSVLPKGSELKGVMIPRYNRERKLTGSLKATKIRLVAEEEVAATGVTIESYKPDQSPKDRVELETATFDQARGLVSSDDPVVILTERLAATGSGLYYYFPAEEEPAHPLAGQGFLVGPATTILRSETLPATSMNFPTHPLRATAMLGVALVSTAVAARPVVTADEKAAVHADAAPRAAAATAAAAEMRAALGRDAAAGAAASKAAAAFLVQADLPPVQPAPLPEPKMLEIEPGPDDTVIDCDGGIYFDPEERVLVYLKNVIVRDPRFDLTGTINELKIFFSEKPADPAKDGKKEKKGGDDFSGFANNLGQVERIVATGAVVLDQKPAKAGEDPIKASGAVFSYNIKADQIIISGGYPWFIKGPQKLRAKQPNLSVKISPKKGTAVVEGGEWTTLLNLGDKNN